MTKIQELIRLGRASYTADLFTDSNTNSSLLRKDGDTRIDVGGVIELTECECMLNGTDINLREDQYSTS